MLNMKRRLVRLEQQGGGLPYHLPMDRWTDEQLLRAVGRPGSRIEDLTDEDFERWFRREPDENLIAIIKAGGDDNDANSAAQD